MMEHRSALPSSSFATRLWSALLYVSPTLLLPAIILPGLLPQRAQCQIAHPIPAPPLRDGRHDFDFNLGTWHTHIRRVLNPLDGSGNTIELNGTVTVSRIWDGAEIEQIEADGSRGHWEGLSLFLYNPQSRQWNQYFINSKIADLGSPLTGEFRDGRADLYSSDTFNGKSILVRAVWSQILPNSHRYEEDFSQDGGQNWRLSFVADLRRENPATPTAVAPPLDPALTGQHDFDFDSGTWKTRTTRMPHPLTGSTAWVDLEGATVVHKVWNGRANLAEYTARGPSGTIQLLALRWFNPNNGEWNLDFANPNTGTLGVPGVGVFKNGRADFYDYEPINGRSTLVRFSIWGSAPGHAQSEQAFSPDGGKTWEVNWINHYSRQPNQMAQR